MGRIQDDDRAAICVATRAGAFRQSGLGALHDDRTATVDTELQNLPLLEQCFRKDDGQRAPNTRAEARSIVGGSAFALKDVFGADDGAEVFD